MSELKRLRFDERGSTFFPGETMNTGNFFFLLFSTTSWNSENISLLLKTLKFWNKLPQTSVDWDSWELLPLILIFILKKVSVLWGKNYWGEDYKRVFGVLDMLYILIWSGAYIGLCVCLYLYVRIHWVVCIRFVVYTVYMLYHNKAN